jgi:hypothetical protein
MIDPDALDLNTGFIVHRTDDGSWRGRVRF